VSECVCVCVYVYLKEQGRVDREQDRAEGRGEGFQIHTSSDASECMASSSQEAVVNAAW
jgi:hypothetical protein